MAITTCAVSGYIYDPFGVALVNKTVSFVPRDWVAGTDGIVVPQTKTATTNGSGLLSSIPLVPGIYKVVFADPAIAGRTQFTISVPNTATANIQDIADFTGQIRQAGFLDGTAGSPVWTFVNDTNTGVFRPSDNTLGFSTGGVSRMTISNAGATLAGLLTGTAVTQSSTDTTAGRLLKVGDFGQGVTGAPPYVADLNDATLATGDYYTNASTLNLTGLPNHYGTLTVKRWSATIIHQSWVDNAQEKQRRLERAYNSGVGWSDWQLVYNRNTILGPVSQSGGVPTGALIERGSNANGEYVRFADGTQICVSATQTVDVTTASGAIYSTPDIQTATLPATFATTTGMVVSVCPANTENAWGAGRPLSTSSVYWRAWRANAVPGQQFKLLIIGRWF